MANTFCTNCGKPIESSAAFCIYCGVSSNSRFMKPTSVANLHESSQAMEQRPVQQMTVQQTPVQQISVQHMPVQQRPVQQRPIQQIPMQPNSYIQNASQQNIQNTNINTNNKRKSKKGILVLVALLVVALVGGGVFFVVNGRNADTTEIPEVKYSFINESPDPTVSCKAVDTIYPTLYNSMDYVIIFEGSCEQGDTDVLVEVEIPGLTEKYSQKFTLNRQLTQIYVKPAINADKSSLASQKKCQINFKVTDIETDKIISQDTKAVSVMSLYDYNLNKTLRYNAWAWLTPENTYVKQLKQEAVQCIYDITDGQLNSIISYQGNEDTMYYECLAMMVAASRMGIRYNSSDYSSSQSGDYLQRVALPEEVITSKSGICIETSLLIASALQSAGYNCMLVFTTGHCQVAVEVGDCTGNYYMIETTRLPVDGCQKTDIVWYMDRGEWSDYLNARDGICIPCNLATNYKFTPVYN